MIRQLLERFGYYRIEALQHWGHCGLCGSPMEGIFERVWAVGVCEKCSALYSAEEVQGE